MAGENEDATHRLLKASLDLIAGQITAYHGRVINTAGDAVLAMFEAVVDGVGRFKVKEAIPLLDRGFGKAPLKVKLAILRACKRIATQPAIRMLMDASTSAGGIIRKTALELLEN